MMTSNSVLRAGQEYVRSYRSLLQDSTRRRIIPRIPSKTKIYSPSHTIMTPDAYHFCIPLLYSGEKGVLGVWDKHAGMGIVKRRLDEDDRSYHVLELSNPRTNLGTFISSPRSVLNALHITLPHMVMVMKNFRRNFAFEVLIMDSSAYRRRFSFATWHNPSSLKKFPFMCQIPLRLEIGWNEIHVNFNDLVMKTYRTNYVETIRVVVYANCKLRQIFFCDDKIMRGDIPVPSMRDFGNLRQVPVEIGPRMHPDTLEHGPDKVRQFAYLDPSAEVPLTRLERDLQNLQKKRFKEVSNQRLSLQPYKTYFRELLQEERQKKKITEKVQEALKLELAKKAILDKAASMNNNNNNNNNNNAAGESSKVATAGDSSKVATTGNVEPKPDGYEAFVVSIPEPGSTRKPPIIIIANCDKEESKTLAEKTVTKSATNSVPKTATAKQSKTQ